MKPIETILLAQKGMARDRIQTLQTILSQSKKKKDMGQDRSKNVLRNDRLESHKAPHAFRMLCCVDLGVRENACLGVPERCRNLSP
jgi:hypothetical protein